MPAVKVKENEPFDVALRRFKRSCEKPVFWLKFVAANFTRSRLRSVSARQQLLSNATPRKSSANSAAPFVCINLQTFVASVCLARPHSRAVGSYSFAVLR